MATGGMTTGLADIAMGQYQSGQAEAAAKRASMLKTAGETGATDEARRTAEEFEAVFVSQMLQHMTAGIKTDGPFGGGPGEGMFRSMLNGEYAKAISGRGGIGIADHIYRQIIALQEV